MKPFFKNVRSRLTLWYVLVFSLILVFYAAVSITFVYLYLMNNLDREMQEDYEIVEEYIVIGDDGSIAIDEKNDPYFHERWFEIWSPEGLLLYRNRPFTGRSLPPLQPDEESQKGFAFRSLRLTNGIRVRMMSGMINIEGNWLYIRLVRSEEKLWRELASFFWLLLIALPVAVLVAGLGGYLMAGKFLAPLDRMAEKARAIGTGNLTERLPVHNPQDEMGNLANAFNELLERIHTAFERLKQFTSDAAHELRTPLTAIRSIGEVGLQNHKSPERYREIIGSMLEENQRLTRLVDNLLFLSRADARSLDIKIEPIDLSAVIRQTVELIQPLAEEKEQRIETKGESLYARADKALLKQALLNLLDNAIKYSPPGSVIRVHLLGGENNTACIRVSDQGTGIAPPHLERIFERFYRVDKGRSREKGGSGLGLAIARWAVEMQEGNITVESEIGKGTTFVIRLQR